MNIGINRRSLLIAAVFAIGIYFAGFFSAWLVIAPQIPGSSEPILEPVVSTSLDASVDAPPPLAAAENTGAGANPGPGEAEEDESKSHPKIERPPNVVESKPFGQNPPLIESPVVFTSEQRLSDEFCFAVGLTNSERDRIQSLIDKTLEKLKQLEVSHLTSEDGSESMFRLQSFHQSGGGEAEDQFLRALRLELDSELASKFLTLGQHDLQRAFGYFGRYEQTFRFEREGDEFVLNISPSANHSEGPRHRRVFFSELPKSYAHLFLMDEN